MAKLRLGVLISGRGSNLKVLIERCAAADFPAEVAAVIANNPDAPGLAHAKAAAMAARVIDHRDFADRDAFDAALTAALSAAHVELVCLAGFMRILSAGFVNHWRDRLINIHPSLLPAFKGRHTHEQVLRAGARFSGCTVHFVRPETDDGPLIVQAVVPVLPDDTPDSLAERVLGAEHRCYPLAVRLIAEGRVRVRDDVVEIADASYAEAALLNPSDSG